MKEEGVERFVGGFSLRRVLALVGGAVLTLAAVSAAAGAAGGAEPRYVDLWGPALGSELPLLDAVDHTGERRRLADLAGQRGLLLFLVRSADW